MIITEFTPPPEDPAEIERHIAARNARRAEAQRTGAHVCASCAYPTEGPGYRLCPPCEDEERDAFEEATREDRAP